MNEYEMLTQLKGDEYRLYYFLIHLSNEYGVIHNVTREQLSDELGLGINKTYEILKTLREKNLIEQSGQKKFIKILPRD